MTRFGLNVRAFGTSVPRFQPRYRALGATAAAAGVAYGVHRQLEQFKDGNIRIPRMAMEAFCGAVGEVAQVCVLYPLETIKVRCQTDSVGMRVVLKQLLETHPGTRSLSALYAGFTVSAICSIIVGAVHYVTFCGSKRLALSITASTSPVATSSNSAPSTDSSSVAASNSAAVSRDEAGCSAMHADHHSVAASQAGRDHVAPAGGAAAEMAEDGEGRGFANMFSAVSSAVLTALIEAPTELFRHQAQAGLCHSNFLLAMGNAVRNGGPGALYWGFLPYCFESFPYDITELATYAHLRDAYSDACNKPSPYAAMLAAIPETCWDLVIGASAGAAATLLSMPFDCVKTYMQTHGAGVGAGMAHGAAHGVANAVGHGTAQTAAAGLGSGAVAVGNGVWGQTAAFFQTGVLMVRNKGVSALFVGTVPRLIQQVPSCTICWWVIEQCRKGLEPYVQPLDVEGPSGAAAH